MSRTSSFLHLASIPHYYKPSHNHYKINLSIWWRRGKCHILTVTERNVLYSVGLGLPQNTWFQDVKLFFPEALLKCQSIRFFKAFPTPSWLSQHTGIQTFSSVLALNCNSSCEKKNMCKSTGSHGLGSSALIWSDYK